MWLSAMPSTAPNPLHFTSRSFLTLRIQYKDVMFLSRAFGQRAHIRPPRPISTCLRQQGTALRLLLRPRCRQTRLLLPLCRSQSTVSTQSKTPSTFPINTPCHTAQLTFPSFPLPREPQHLQLRLNPNGQPGSRPSSDNRSLRIWHALGSAILCS